MEMGKIPLQLLNCRCVSFIICIIFMHISLEDFPFFPPFSNILSECSFWDVILADTYCRNKSFQSSLPMYIGPKILANTAFYSEERQNFSKSGFFCHMYK